jgi:Bacterial PH domain
MNGQHDTLTSRAQHEPDALMAPGRNASRVVRSPGWLLLTGGLRLFGGMVLMATAVAPGLGGGAAARVALGVASVALVTIAVRTFLEGVYVEADGVVVRNPFRSWRLRWDEIEDVGRRPRNPLVWLTLRSGKRIALCGWGWPSAARRRRMASLLMAARPEAR